MTCLVLSIGGSILTPEGTEVEYISSLAALLKKFSNDNKIYVVVGGGPLARKYITIARSLGGNEIELDEVGIAATRLNARLLITALEGFAYPRPAETFHEAVVQAQRYAVIVMGGTHPGHTTDAVAVMLGEFVGAEKFINVTSVDGVYTAVPKVDSNAKKLDRLTADELIQITSKSIAQAGPHIVIDPLAARVIKRSGITTYVLDGRNLVELENVMSGKTFSGTIIE
ncbi:UMP kinase [[Eubacterium] cellulosolvens]